MNLGQADHRTRQQLIEENQQLNARLAQLEALIASAQGRPDTLPAAGHLAPAISAPGTPRLLHEVDERLHACLDNMLDCFAILSSVRDGSGQIIDFRYDYINRAGAQANGHPAEQHLGRTLLEILPQQRRCGMLDIYRAVVETGEPAELEAVGDRDDTGQPRHPARVFEVRVWKLGDGFAVAWRDITARKQAEEDLHRLTRHARCSLWRAVVTGLSGWDRPEALEMPGQFMRWEGKVFDLEAARRVIDLRLEPGERYEDVWCRDRVPEDNLRMARTAILAMQQGDRTYEQEFRCHDRHGQIHWLYESVTLVPLDRERWQVFGVVVNISAQKAAEEALRASEQRFRKVFEQSALGMALVGRDHRIGSANARLCQMLGYTEAELQQRTFEQITHPEDVALGVDRTRQLAEGEIPTFSLEKRYLRKDGQVIWGSVTVSTIHDAAGRPFTALATIEDVTQRKRAAEELERAKGTAEAANRAKDQFIAVLSHELRTPLTPAVATLSVLESDGRLPQDVREDLMMVRRNLDLEVRLIADLLDISRVISGKLHLDRRLTDVAAAIRDAARIVSGDLEAKGQTLTIETPGAPYLLIADSARLEQVFWNLLRNAIKFTPPRGAIAIRAALLPAGHRPPGAPAGPVSVSGAGELVITVTDTGRGIAPQLLPRLFLAFEQAQDARGLGGLGLGLAICRAVVEMHGGSISASSEGPDKGATFTLRLPAAQCLTNRMKTHAPPQSPAAAPAGAAVPRPVKILLVEDNHDTALALQRLLRSRGHEVRVAGSISAAMQAMAAQTPDLLISDIGLPDGSGLQLMRQISAVWPGLPAVALSGYGQEQDLRQSQEAGFALHLTKPIDPARLYEAIAVAMASATGVS